MGDQQLAFGLDQFDGTEEQVGEFAVLPLVTSSFSEMHVRHQAGERGIVPVRTSLGKPRFSETLAVAPYISELAPYGLLKLPKREFQAKYRERLEKKGVRAIEKRLCEVYAEYQRPLALLCYEDVHKGEWCHRQMFAQWWYEQTGQAVPELPKFEEVSK